MFRRHFQSAAAMRDWMPVAPSASVLLFSFASLLPAPTTTHRAFHQRHQQQQQSAAGSSSAAATSSSSSSSSSFSAASAAANGFPGVPLNRSVPFVVKDREPFPGSEVRDGKLKLAVLIDGEKGTTPQNYFAKLDDEIAKLGTVCLRRYFRYEKNTDWSTVFHQVSDARAAEAKLSEQKNRKGSNKSANNIGSNSDNIDEDTNKHNSSDSAALSNKRRQTPNTLLGPPQFFRVDSFVPIHLQLSADAAHIIEFHHDNLVSGVVFVVDAGDVDGYTRQLANFAGNDNDVKLFVFDAEKLRAKA